MSNTFLIDKCERKIDKRLSMVKGMALSSKVNVVSLEWTRNEVGDYVTKLIASKSLGM